MAKHGTALVDGGFVEFMAAVVRQLPRDIDRTTMDGWVNNQFGLQSVLRKALVPSPVLDVVAFPNAIDWSKVYRELGMEAEFVAALPDLDREEKENLWWVPVIKGITSNKIVARFQKLGVDVYIYVDNLDKDVTINNRNPADGSYVVRFRQNIEADSEYKNKSANMLAKAGVKGITLTERLLLELGFFLQTGDHLDKENITLCSGSRYSDGDVPSVSWYAGGRELCVRWCSPDDRHGALRARAVVSLGA